MGSVVRSGRADKRWMYSNGTFQVLFGNAVHSHLKLTDAPSIVRDILPIIGEYLNECWPDQYDLNYGALHYLDLDAYPAAELDFLFAAIKETANDFETGDIDKGLQYNKEARQDLANLARELAEVIRAAIEAHPGKG